MGHLVLKGRMFDGDGFIEDGSVLINQETGKIEAAGRSSDVEVPKESEVISHSGATILPGLVDAHLHFFGSSKYDLLDWVTIPDTMSALRGVRDMRLLLQAGFTAVRDLGSKAATYLSWAEREGAVEGPRIIAASKSLAQTGGNDDPPILPLNVSQQLSYSYYCDGPWECRRAVRMCLRDGAEVIKVYASGTFAQGKRAKEQLTVEELKAIVDEAHRASVKVAAHAYGEAALSNVIEAGVDSIEHGIALTPEIASQIKKRGIYYVPTLSAFVAAKPTANKEREALIKRHLTDDMRLAKEHDLKVVCGTDYVGSATEPHGQNYMEIVNLSKYMSVEEALLAATRVGAECLGLENRGSLIEGFSADVVMFDGDPRKSIEALAPKNVLCVVKEGRVHARRV